MQAKATRIYWPLVTAACTLLVWQSVAQAQPLVTGDLVIYYDFDNFTNTVMDGSGNGFNGKVQDMTRNMLDGATGRTEIMTTGTIVNDKSNPKRGAGAIRFNQPESPSENPVFVDLDGGVIKATHPELLPSTAVTYAAWVNLAPVDAAKGWNSPASIFQGSTAGPGHGNPHIHAEGSGAIRVALRDEFGTNIVNSSQNGPHPFPNQPDIDSMGAAPMPWPTNEWFHVAVTYNKDADNGAGDYGIWYNGVKIQGGPANGAAGASDLGQWDQRPFDAGGNFFDGLGLGAVYDSGGRRTQGMMDEAYIFRRALSEEEIGMLVNFAPPAVAGDYNSDGKVDASDYVVWRNGDSPDDTQAGYDLWKANYGIPAGSGAAAVAAVPEPASLGLLLVCLGFLSALRRR